MAKPKVAVLVGEELRRQMFRPKVWDSLLDFAELVPYPEGCKPSPGRAFDRDAGGRMLQEADACITSWGTPLIDHELISPRLRFLGHAAGSIKPVYSEACRRQGVRVSSAAPVIAKSVGEMALAMTLALLRRLHEHRSNMAAGKFREKETHEKTLALIGKEVGLVGLGSTAREFIRFLRPFEVQIAAYDPYVSPAEAEKLGVELAGLGEVLRDKDVVSLHAASTPETYHLIGARELALIKDDAVFINTARGALVDEDALIKELKKGRFLAGLDVYEVEPLPEDSELRRLPNVLTTPHIAGPTVDRYWCMAQAMVEECRRFFAGEDLLYEVPLQRLDHLA